MAEIIADYGFQATSEKRCEKSGVMVMKPAVMAIDLEEEV
jgi:hypothetical protein